MTTNEIENFTQDVDTIIAEWFKNQAFSLRKITDTPTDALQVTNKKYVDEYVSSYVSSLFPSGIPGDPTKIFEFMEDFEGGITSPAVNTPAFGKYQWEWNHIAGAANSVTLDAGSAGHPGRVNLLGTGGTGNGVVMWLESSFSHFGPMNQGGYHFIIGLTPSSASSISIRAGIADDGGDRPTDGIFLECNDSVDWHGICKNGASVSTTVGSSTLLAAYTTLEIIMNTAGTSVEFKVNGISLGSLTSNIPSNIGGFFAQTITRTVGGKSCEIDYFFCSMPVTR